MTIWSTPNPIFARANAEFRFEIDLCADPENAKCTRFLLRGESLYASWDHAGWAWLNPPYGEEISQWMKKAADCGRRIVAMIPARTNPPWWHEHVLRGARDIRCIKRKVKFVANNGKKGVPSFGVVLAIFEAHKGSPIITSWDWRD